MLYAEKTKLCIEAAKAHRRTLNADRPSSDAGSVNNRKKFGRRDGWRWILAYWTIGPTISESSILGNLADC